MLESLGGRARNAAKWSLVSEGAAKIIIPVTQIILARILAPEAFGVLATVIMISSFAAMLADAGFQKYLVQHEFPDTDSLYRAANVAFWSSMVVGLTLLGGIGLFRDVIATFVGAPGLGVPIAVAALSIPMTVFVSTQQALFRRAFEYKKLLPIRIIFATIPLITSVPLALLGFGYWSLILGVVAANTFNAFAMTAVSPWKPRLFFSFKILREMFSFSGWSLIEAVTIWATSWAGVFIVGNILTPHELGLYRQPILVVNSLFAVVTAATTPILFAALSRLQVQPGNFRRFFLKFQFYVALIVFPTGVGAFLYRDFFTYVLFGPQWGQAALMFGAWALTSSLGIVFSHYYSEVFRSLGRPRISVLSQCLYMSVMIPALYMASLDGFVTLVIVSAAVRSVAILINQILVFIVAGIGFIEVLKNLYAPLVASALMGAVAWWFAQIAAGDWLWSLLGIVGCSLLYACICLCFPRPRAVLVDATSSLRRQRMIK